MKSTTVFNSFSSSFYFFFFFFSWSTLLLSSSSHPRVVVAFSLLNSEGDALLSLLEKFSFAIVSYKLNWKNLSSSNISPCEWSGVACNTQNTHIVSLNLSGYYISGQLGPQIGQLTYLKSVDLRFNTFIGSIPIELWNCSHLQYLDLSLNRFTGQLGPQIGGLRYLKSVDLSNNRFNGLIPGELWNCSRLQYLYLSDNEFSGELPTTVSNLQQLIYFSASNNYLIGRIPETLFEISGLEYVSLGRNNFNGSIPVNIGNATNMKGLWLGGYVDRNQLHGSIPISMANCTKLEELILSNNDGLSGEIPLGVWRIPTLAIIDVSSNNLSGELPVEMTTGLHHLVKISLWGNHFSGLIPETLGINSSSLETVDFRNNSFSGEIPPNLCFGKQLKYMWLNQNQFHGSIPPSYLTGNCNPLKGLYLGGNKLTDSFPHFEKNSSLSYLDISRNNIQGIIPSSICNLVSSLNSLDLSGNQMNGTLPHCLGDFSQLKTLNLRNNDFSGIIPQDYFTASTSLGSLDLNGNRFQGKIPRSLGVVKIFRYLDLGNNQFNDTFPSFLDNENSSWLEILVLRSNKLYGLLPRLAFTNLKVLDISNNYFTGDLPLQFFLGLDAMKHIDQLDPELFDTSIHYDPTSTVIIHKGKEITLNHTFMRTFRAIDLSKNIFEGTIPESIGELVSLHMLNLSSNNFKGFIPSSLGNLSQLESLDLSRNNLYGEIPRQLTNINFLAVLNLSCNNLIGRIPSAGQFKTFTNASFDGNPELCGEPLSRGCDPQIQIEEKEGSEDSSNPWSFGWEPVAIGYGCGVLIGLVLQYFIFTKAFLYKWFG